jgi:hypothetical protein
VNGLLNLLSAFHVPLSAPGDPGDGGSSCPGTPGSHESSLKTKNPPDAASGGFGLKVNRRKEIFSFVAFNYTTFTLKED